MPFEIDASAVGRKADDYANLSRLVPGEVRKRLGWIAVELERRTKEFIGEGLFRKPTGTLLRGVKARLYSDDTIIMHGGTKYTLIHDVGGVTKPHIIRPVHAKVLVFAVGGIAMPTHIRIGNSKKVRSLDALRPGQTAQGVAIAHEVHHPGSRIKAKSFSAKGWERAKPYAAKVLADIRDMIAKGGK